jgi:hypothetical protein
MNRNDAENSKRMMYESVGMAYVAPRAVDTTVTGDHGSDPVGDGTFRMVPSGDVVSYEERCKRLKARGTK